MDNGRQQEYRQNRGGYEADLVFSCPPYADLEVYSDDERDISNMQYDDFISIYREIIEKSCNMLKQDRFAVFVVSEVRDSKGNYYNFVGDTVKAFTDLGLHFYNDIILVNNIGTAMMRASRQFPLSRKVARIHQNVLVFYKGDPKNIKDNYKEIEVMDLENEQ